MSKKLSLPRNPKVTEQQVRDVLRQVYDPELGVNLVDLNMVRKIEIDGNKVTVGLVLTAPECPMGYLIAYGAQHAVASVPGVKEANVEILDEPYERPEGSLQDWLDRAFGR